MANGFGDRIFLTIYEWETFLKRRPVKYISKYRLKNICDICGLPATYNNPLQNAHKIPFMMGVIKLGLTPDFLDKQSNTVTAHRKICNKSAELTYEQCVNELKLIDINELPIYLKD